MQILDYALVAIYLVGMILGGAFSSRGTKGNADEYFTGKGTLSGLWGTILIGLSIAATLFSGISLVVYVSAAYTEGVRILLGLVSLLIAWLVLHGWFLPRFLGGGWKHPYEIVEHRFGRTARLFMSAQFLFLRLGWMGVLIYAPTTIILGSTGLGDHWFWPLVLTIGAVSTLYAAVGGIRGVIVMDAMQFLITAGCMLVILVFIKMTLNLPMSEIVGELHSEGRLALFDPDGSPVRTLTFWSILIGMLVTSFGAYLADQMSLQRFLASATQKEAGRSFVVNIAGAYFIAFILVAVGLLLWLWYRHHPDTSIPGKADQILAHFVATQLPAGMSGLLIAAILAATIDSMTSGVNAVSSSLINDWVVPLGRTRSSAELVRIGRLASVGIGALATVFAGLAAALGPALDSSQILMGSFLGSMLGCMVIAVSGLPVRKWTVLAGMLAGLVSGWLVAASTLSVMWVAPAALALSLGLPLCDALARRLVAQNCPAAQQN